MEYSAKTTILALLSAFAFSACGTSLSSFSTGTSISAGVFTWHNDPARTGLNSSETILTPSNVSGAGFGRLFSVSIDGYVYAQPLYAAQVNVGTQGTHNVVYVASEHDSVYALDADTGASLWQISFINAGAGITTVSSADVSCSDLTPELGITSTPVIDPVGSTLYVEAATKENGQFFHRLHALDLATGKEKFGGPVTIAATVSGTGDASSGGLIAFDPLQHGQRPALLLSQGQVYVAFASHCDNNPYHGWIFAYNASTLARDSVFITTPNGSEGGIWMTGGGPSADSAGNVYAGVGNGTYNGTSDFGESVLKLSAGLHLLDWFTPFDNSSLSGSDLDIGTSTSMLIPDQAGAIPHLMLATGKAGSLYVVNRDNMGKFNAVNNSQIVQTVNISDSLFGSPSYWNGNIYYVAQNEGMHQYKLNNGSLTGPTFQDATTYSFPGGSPVVSSSGTSNAIVWVNHGSTTSDLRAHDANNVSTLLYSSETAGLSNPGYVKFTSPMVFGGKVYVGTTASLEVYGLH